MQVQVVQHGAGERMSLNIEVLKRSYLNASLVLFLQPLYELFYNALIQICTLGIQ